MHLMRAWAIRPVCLPGGGANLIDKKVFYRSLNRRVPSPLRVAAVVW